MHYWDLILVGAGGVHDNKGLISSIANGEIVETYPNRKPCPAALMLGFISDKPCHAVVAICGDRLSVITVYWPDDECLGRL